MVNLSAPLRVLSAMICGCSAAFAHDSSDPDNPDPRYDWSVTPPGRLVAQAGRGANLVPAGDRMVRTNRPAQAEAFARFAPAVRVRWDERYLYVESNGLPAHNMMVGITAWQQQVPLPQNYTGLNAWQIPLSPLPAREVISIKNRFLRGAIAIAANGIPIFNPQNNRGELSAEIGELDQWGGHCGRADDYHYHAAPLHLQSALGKSLPIAYALDGYPIYGLTEPDGSEPVGLDACHGHTTPALGYHYHASTKYPYVNGGFHGEVVERGGQVDPQPRAQPVRPALPALPGAKITDFTGATEGKQGRLTYALGAKQGTVNFADAGDGSWKFQFVSTEGVKTEQTYTRREGGAGPGEPRPQGEPPRNDRRRPASPSDGGATLPPEAGDRRGTSREGEAFSTIGMDEVKKPRATFLLTSPEIEASGRLPADYTGDGSGATLPLVWKGAPAGTESYALVMDHLAPGNVVKSYWVVWDIPASTTSLPKNVSGVGKLGRSFRGQVGYEPPHSQGPGDKTYVLTVYALSAPPQIAQEPREVTRDILLTAIKDKVLASASLSVVYAREGAAPPQGGAPPARPPRSE